MIIESSGFFHHLRGHCLELILESTVHGVCTLPRVSCPEGHTRTAIERRSPEERGEQNKSIYYVIGTVYDSTADYIDKADQLLIHVQSNVL